VVALLESRRIEGQRVAYSLAWRVLGWGRNTDCDILEDMENEYRPLYWVGSSHQDLKKFPERVMDVVGKD